MPKRISVLVALLTGIQGGGMPAGPGIIDNEGIEIVEIEHAAEYSIGLPVWIAFTLRADPDTAFHNLLFPDLVDLRSAVGLEMTGPSGSRIQKPTPVVEPDFGRSPRSLMPGESRRMMVDISALLGLGLKEGEHTLRLTYLSPRIALPSKPFTIRLRQPVFSEQPMLAYAVPSRPKVPNWAIWMRTCHGTPIPVDRIATDSPAALSFVLNYLFCGSEPLGSIDPAIPERFTAIPEPERGALHAELLRLRGASAAEARIAELRRQFPGLAWWLDKIDRNAGYLATFSQRPR